jgi:hypothetical protein
MEISMKFLLFLIPAALAAQTCAHTLRWTPQGAVLSFRNGILIDDSEVTRSARQIAPNRFGDQDSMAYVYIREVDTPAPHYSAPNKETQVCTGNLNPPPRFVPYTGATQDVDLGQFALRTRRITLSQSGQGFRGYLLAGPPPTNTTAEDGTVYSAVVFVDQTDQNKLKLLKLKPDSTFVTVELEPAGPIAALTECAPIVTGTFTRRLFCKEADIAISYMEAFMFGSIRFQ